MPFSNERTWDFTPGHHRIAAVFDAEQCAEIIGYHRGLEHFQAASTAGQESYRNTDVYWLKHGKRDHVWIYERLAEVTRVFNDAHYGFEIDACTDLQLARYAPGQHYDWHSDLGGQGYSRRKLSVAVLLSPLDAFTGGRLEFGIDRFVQAAEAEPGDAIVFPSWLAHRVTPVTEGERWTLVGWWLGPPFR